MHRRVGPVDTIWLNMDRPTNLMVIESLMTCDGTLDHDRFREVLRSRVVDRYPVFRQRAVAPRVPLGLPRWEDDPDFDLDRHLVHTTLPSPGSDAQLQHYVDRHLDQPLPRDRPLWQVHIVDGHRGGSAVYSRLHHALADGMALMQVLLSLTDAGAVHEEPANRDQEVAPARDGDLGGLLRALGRAVEVGAAAPRLLVGLTPRSATSLARRTSGVAAKLTLTRNPESALSGNVRGPKRAVWAPPIPLAEVIATAHRTGTTVNDVLVAALAGALTAYLCEHDGVARDVPTMVPVNLRSPGEPLPPELGNRFALVLLALPSGLSTPFARLAETKRRMDAIKDSPEAVMTSWMIRGIGRTGRDLERVIVDFFANKATGVTTNVAGPRETRYLADTRITSMLGWAPESGRQTLGTCIFTYDGQVHVGFKVDARTIESPDDLVRAFQHEIADLLRLARGPEEGP